MNPSISKIVILVFFYLVYINSMLSDKSSICPINLLDTAHKKRGVKAAIVNAGKKLPMVSAMDAVKKA